MHQDPNRGEGRQGHIAKNLAGTLNLPGFFGNENHFVKTTTIKKLLPENLA